MLRKFPALAEGARPRRRGRRPALGLRAAPEGRRLQRPRLRRRHRALARRPDGCGRAYRARATRCRRWSAVQVSDEDAARDGRRRAGRRVTAARRSPGSPSPATTCCWRDPGAGRHDGRGRRGRPRSPTTRTTRTGWPRRRPRHHHDLRRARPAPRRLRRSPGTDSALRPRGGREARVEVEELRAAPHGDGALRRRRLRGRVRRRPPGTATQDRRAAEADVARAPSATFRSPPDGGPMSVRAARAAGRRSSATRNRGDRGRRPGWTLPADLEALLGEGSPSLRRSHGPRRHDRRERRPRAPCRRPADQRRPGRDHPRRGQAAGAVGPDAERSWPADDDDVLTLGLTRTTSTTLAEEGTLGERRLQAGWCPTSTTPAPVLRRLRRRRRLGGALADLVREQDSGRRGQRRAAGRLRIAGWVEARSCTGWCGSPPTDPTLPVNLRDFTRAVFRCCPERVVDFRQELRIVK